MIKEDKIQLKIAGFNISIILKEETEFPAVARLFKQKILVLLKEFICEIVEADFELVVIYVNSFDSIINVKNKKHLIGFYEEVSPLKFLTYYHVSEQQFLVVLRDIVQALISKTDGLIMHGSAAALDSDGILFFGDSGAGKSTIVKILSPEYETVADDIFVIRKKGGRYYIYQTPLLQKNYSFKVGTGEFILRKIFFLKKGLVERKDRLGSEEEIFQLLSKQLFTSTLDAKKQIEFVLRLAFEQSQVYLLTFTKNNKFELLKVINE